MRGVWQGFGTHEDRRVLTSLWHRPSVNVDPPDALDCFLNGLRPCAKVLGYLIDGQSIFCGKQ
jgi:hypothetical protein